VPPLTGAEALRAFRRLYRFAFKRTFRGKLLLTSGNRRTGRHQFIWRVNPSGGWHELVHVLSHYAERSGHNGKHARMERRMIREVKRRGWLDGTLTRPAPASIVKDVRHQRYARVLARLVSWEAKLKRAQRAIARLHRSQRYYERQH